MDEGRFFTLKAYALLHDPPDKTWSIKNHEPRAHWTYLKLLEGTPLGGGVPPEGGEDAEVVRRADRLASAVDRLTLAAAVGRGYFANYRRLHNVFDPERSVDLQPPDSAAVDSYMRRANNALKGACRGLRECYHVLYALFEGLWVAEGLPPGLADTRAPTHDVFDHLYASAAMVNWVAWGQEPKGYFAVVDVPGVQRFVAAARKAGDFWAGSWIVSMAVWLTVWPLAWELGPDVLLRPTPRLNPWYYGFLAAKLGALHGELAEVAWRAAGQGGQPPPGLLRRMLAIPFIGEAAYLILPPKRPGGGQWTADKVEGALRKNFREALECLRYVVAGVEAGGVCADLRAAVGPRWDAIHRELGPLADVRLPLRVKVVDVGEVYQSIDCGGLKSELGELYDRVKEEGCRAALLMPALFERASKEDGRKIPTPGPWFDPDGMPLCPLAVKHPLNVFQPGPWRYSSLSDEPAVVGVRKGAQGEYNRGDLARFLDAFKDRGLGEEDLSRVLRPGEFLGPTDLTKRLIYLALAGREGRADGDREHEVFRKFETTEDVAVARLKSAARHIRAAAEKVRALEDCARVLNFLETAEGRSMERVWGPGPDLVDRVGKDWEGCVSKVAHHVEGLDSVFGEFRGVDPKELLGPRLFYAVVRGDGDSMGKVVRGHLDGWYRKMERVLEAAFAEVEGDREAAERDREAAKRFLAAVGKALGGRVPPTPAYLAAVGKALALTALRDWAAALGRNGMLIYAGGDDVVALHAVEDALQAVAAYRRNYWGDGGFHRVGQYVAPALVAYGRSFSVRFVHLMDIMADELAESHDDLERAKEARWRLCRDGACVGWEKDSLAVSSSRTEGVAVLPIRQAGELDLLLKAWAAMLGRRLGRNAPYDVERALAGWPEGLREGKLEVTMYALKRNVAKGADDVKALLEEAAELAGEYGVEWLEGFVDALRILRRLP